MVPNPDANADNLIADALRLATSLDTPATRDWLERIRPAIAQGRDGIAELQRRRECVALKPEDAALLDRMIDTIRARLKFLEGVERQGNNRAR